MDPITHTFIIAVEKIIETFIEFPVIVIIVFKHERLIKPGTMPQVPLGRAYVGDGLGYKILNCQRFAELDGLFPDGFKTLDKTVDIFCLHFPDV
jgi:hypothetical protein